jgi:hypothetical protein
MASTEPKISKLGFAGKTRDITITIPDTLEIIRKSGSSTCQGIIMPAQNSGFLNTCGVEKHKKKTASKNLGQYKCTVINRIFNNPAPPESCGCQIK